MSSGDDRDPWAKQPRESHQQFQAFTHFLEGHELQAIAPLVGVSVRTISRWRGEKRWNDRRDALEVERDRKLLFKLRAVRRDVIDRHMKLLDASEALAAQRLQQLDGKMEEVSYEAVVRSLSRIIDRKRAMLGMPVDVVETRVGPPVTSEENDAAAILQDPELLAEYDRLAARVAAKGAGPVEADAGGDGGEAEQGPVEAGAAP